MGKLWRIAPVASLVAALSMIMLPGTASADSYGIGPDTAGWLADDGDHDWCFEGSFPSSWEDNATDRHDYLHSATNFGGGTEQGCVSGMDVRWAGSSTLGDRGTWSCLDTKIAYTSNGQEVACDVARLTIRTTLSNSQAYKTMCHELGHSVGAQHYSGSDTDCMVSGSSTKTTYRSHLINHMNNYVVVK